jgi:hypothetical protein
MMKDEDMAYNYNCSNFERLVKDVEQLQFTTEKAFVSISPEEIK